MVVLKRETGKMFRWIRQSIKWRLALYFILFSSLPLAVVSIYLYKEAVGIVEIQAKKYAQTVLSQTVTQMNQLMDHVTNASVNLITHPDIQEEPEGLSEYQMKIRDRNIENLLLSMAASRPEISSIYMCMNDGRMLSSVLVKQENDCLQTESYREAVHRDLKPVWLGVHKNEFEEGTVHRDEHVVTLARSIYSKNNFDVLGVLIMNISIETIDNIFNKSLDGEPELFYIIDNEKNVVYHSDPGKYKIKLNEPYLRNVLSLQYPNGFIVDDGTAKKYIRYYQSPKYNWTYVAELPVIFITRNSDAILRTIVFVMLVCFIFSVIIAFVISNRFTNPFKQLIGSMRRVKDGSFERISTDREDEIGVLTHNYNSMITEIQRLLIRIEKENSMKREAELNMLQAQITPHFLYNALNAIKSLSRIQGNEIILKMSSSLISLLQMSINKKSSLISIREELEMVGHYITLQDIRYPGKIKVLFETDETLFECLTLKLVLQPLVENSIIHGFNLSEKIGIVVIRVFREGEDVIMEVEDNGKGMEPGHSDSFQFSGIGMKNVDERIKMHYGEHYGVTIHSKPGVNFIVRIRIPFHARPYSQ